MKICHLSFTLSVCKTNIVIFATPNPLPTVGVPKLGGVGPSGRRK
jgi:hypothetical protein